MQSEDGRRGDFYWSRKTKEHSNPREAIRTGMYKTFVKVTRDLGHVRLEKDSDETKDQNHHSTAKMDRKKEHPDRCDWVSESV